MDDTEESRNMGDDKLTESELYKELGALTKARDQWEEKIPYVSHLLAHESARIQAKALWLLAEMGLAYPQLVRDTVPLIASFRNNPTPLLRERALNAIGRIGRGDYRLIEPYWAPQVQIRLTSCASVPNPVRKLRLSSARHSISMLSKVT